MSRVGEVARDTRETKIALSIDLDGTGEAQIATGVGFFDHMLDAVARHGLFDLRVAAEGDLHTGAHHTVEDVGICLGQGVARALGDKAGIVRVGSCLQPMDETLALVAVDVSGRPHLTWAVEQPNAHFGGFDTDLAPEFFGAFVLHAGLALHVRMLSQGNPHHVMEAAFKGFARAVSAATRLDPRVRGVPSTKGAL